jgi:hypothetical protein
MAKIAKRVAKANEAFVGKSNLTVEDAVKLIKGGFGQVRRDAGNRDEPGR